MSCLVGQCCDCLTGGPQSPPGCVCACARERSSNQSMLIWQCQCLHIFQLYAITKQDDDIYAVEYSESILDELQTAAAAIFLPMVNTIKTLF